MKQVGASRSVNGVEDLTKRAAMNKRVTRGMYLLTSRWNLAAGGSKVLARRALQLLKAIAGMGGDAGLGLSGGKLVPARAEFLEGRVLLSGRGDNLVTPTFAPGVPGMWGEDSAGYQTPYVLHLKDTDANGQPISPDSWAVNWGDGTSQTFAGTATTVTHTYSLGMAAAYDSITASATIGTNTHQAVVPNLDPSFGTGGIVSSNVSGNRDMADAVAVQPDGKILVAGSVAGAGDWDFAVVRYNKDGTTDFGFGSSGKVKTDFASSADIAESLVLLPDGRFLVGGYNQLAGNNNIEVARYLANGTLDTSFGTGGKAVIDLGMGETVYTMIAQGDKILVGGDSSSAMGFVARITSTGTLDSTFGAAGEKYLAWTMPSSGVRALATQSDGKIVVAGTAYNSNRGYIGLARLSADGALDGSFGTAGMLTNYYVQADSWSYVGGVGIQSNGRIVVGGVENSWWLRTRAFLPDGTVDTSYGIGGTTINDVAQTSAYYNIPGFFMQPDGKVILVGSTSSNFAVFRLNADGTADTTFNGGHTVITTVGASGSARAVVTVTADQKMVVVGHFDRQDGSGEDFVTAKYFGDSSELPVFLPVTPFGPPTNLVATPTSPNEIDLAWTDNATIETGFNIQRSSDGATWSDLAITSDDVTAYADTGLSEGTLYYYRVCALDDEPATTDYAAFTSQYTLPAAPSNAVATYLTPTTISISWQNHAASQTAVLIDWSDSSNFNNVLGSTSVGAGSTTAVLTGTFSPLTTYFVRVSVAGLGSQPSLFSTAQVTTPTYLASPRGVVAAVVNQSQIKISWASGQTGGTSLLIEKSASATGGWSTAGTVSASATDFTDTSPAANTWTYYRVSSVDSTGNSVASTVVSAYNSDGSVHGASPTNFGVTLVADNRISSGSHDPSVSLAWTFNDATNSGFVIQVSKDASFTTAQTYSVITSARTYPYMPLASATRYYLRIASSNSEGISAFTPPVIVVMPPANLRSAYAETKQIAITWTPGDSNVNVAIERRKLQVLGSSYNTNVPFTYDSELNDNDAAHPSEDYQTIATVDASQGIYTDTSAASGVMYDYRIHAESLGTSSTEFMTSSVFQQYYNGNFAPNDPSHNYPDALLDSITHVVEATVPAAPPTLQLQHLGSDDVGTNYLISWSNNDAKDFVQIEYSSNGTSWSPGTGYIPASTGREVDATNMPTSFVYAMSKFSSVPAMYVRARYLAGDQQSTPSNVLQIVRQTGSSDTYRLPIVSVYVSNPISASEGYGGYPSAMLTFTRNPNLPSGSTSTGLESPLSIHFSQVAGNALSTDFVGVPQSVTIPAGQNSVSYTITAYAATQRMPVEIAKLAVTPDPAYLISGVFDYTSRSSVLEIDDPNWIDLDVDSNNQNINNAGRTTSADKSEDNPSLPGKIIPVSDGDADGDSVPDYADGYTSQNGTSAGGTSNFAHFAKLAVQVPYWENFATAKFRFVYSGSDPDALGQDYALPDAGSLRIWTRDGNSPNRSGKSVADGGNYIAPNTIYTASQLGLNWYRNILASVGFTYYIEAVKSDSSLTGRTITLEMDPTGSGNFSVSDTVLITAAETKVSVDNDRDGTITFTGSDATSAAKPFLFWLNDNSDGWGGDDYPTAVSVDPAVSGFTDASTPDIGSSYSPNISTLTSEQLRDIAERDLSDFAQIGFTWPKSIDGQVTSFRLKLDSSDPLMSIRLFSSALKQGMPNDTLSATSQIDDPAVIDSILDQNAWAGQDHGALGIHMTGDQLDAGKSITWAPGSQWVSFSEKTDDAGNHLLEMMFEGLKQGNGTLTFQALHGNQVLTSSTVYLRLRPTDELYDHYSVSYNPVGSPSYIDEATQTFRTDVNPLNDANPVATVANLVGSNQERSRFEAASNDYLLLVHGWNMTKYERIAYGDSTFKRMYWTGYKGQVGLFDWPTQTTTNPLADPGNYDRSDFVAFNSAPGLIDALHKIRASAIAPLAPLNVTALAHSMGNVVLSEALYQSEAAGQAGNKLVDSAIMSQAAISSAYFNADSSALPLIYGPITPDNIDAVNAAYLSHVTTQTFQDGHAITTYKGFAPLGQSLPVIGGSTPRYASIGLSAGKIYDFYNPEDHALAGWKLDQSARPTRTIAPAGLYGLKNILDFGNVTFPALDPTGGFFWDSMIALMTGRFAPRGFNGAEYSVDTPVVQNVPQDPIVVRHLGGEDLPLTYATNRYEMFAFGASSVVWPVGATSNAAMPGVFDQDGSLNLTAIHQADGSSRFTNSEVNHSAEFNGAMLGIGDYWKNVMKRIDGN